MKITANFVNENREANSAMLRARLEVVEYLPFAEKRALVERVIDKSIEYFDNYFMVDEITKYLVFTMEVLKAYTNLEFNEDMELATLEFDMLCASGLLSKINALIEGEYKALIELLNMQTNYILQNNNPEYHVIQLVNKVSDEADKIINFVSDKLNDLDLDSLNVSAEDIEKLKAFLSK